MDLTSVATWVGLEPTPERLSRLDWATQFITGAARAIAEVEGIRDDEVPDAQPSEIPVRYEVPGESPGATRPCELGVLEAALAIRRGELSPRELL